MPENSFERLGTPTAPRAEVARVGPGWGHSTSYATADDPKLHLPLSTPGGNPPPSYVPPPPQPSEQQHRDALIAAIETQRDADAKLTAATEAHARALKLIKERQQVLAGFASLDDERLARTLDSLRDDDGGTTLPGTDDRLIKREIARIEVEDAERAAETLMHDLILAREQQGAAAKQVNMLATSVLSHEADDIADRHNELLRQAAVELEKLHEFNHFTANTGVPLSGKVTSLLLAGGTAGLTRLRDTSGWRAARDRLIEDPQAEIDIKHMPSKPYVVDNSVIPVGGMREEDRLRLLWEQEQRKTVA
jgi:hypothetical protein